RRGDPIERGRPATARDAREGTGGGAWGRPPVRGAGQAGGGCPVRRRVVHALRPPTGPVREAAMNWVASALLVATGLDGAATVPPAVTPERVEQLAKEKSPKALVQALTV